jgi:hypothetical protein
MKYFPLVILLFITLSVKAQEQKIVTLVVSGQGKTQEEARQNALRSAVEQAFGNFISSKTEVLNDTLVKDEIVSISNGNIQKYEVVSDNIISINQYSTVLKATVSISQLTDYCKTKGISIEFQGGLFAQNMALQEFYENSEKKAWENTLGVVKQILENSFDYKIQVTNPVQTDGKYLVGIEINIELNETFEVAIRLVRNFCKSVSLDKNGAAEYVNAGKDIFPITFPNKNITAIEVGIQKLKKGNHTETIFLRTRDVANSILSLPWEVAELAVNNFKIKNGLDEIDMKGFGKKNKITVYGGYMLTEEQSGKEINAFILDGSLKKFYQLFGWTISGGGSKFSGDISQNGLQGFRWPGGGGYIGGGSYAADNYNIFPSKGPKRKPIEISPIFNFVSAGPFLKIHIDDIRDINEIKKMTEFKIIPKQ